MVRLRGERQRFREALDLSTPRARARQSSTGGEGEGGREGERSRADQPIDRSCESGRPSARIPFRRRDGQRQPTRIPRIRVGRAYLRERRGEYRCVKDDRARFARRSYRPHVYTATFHVPN